MIVVEAVLYFAAALLALPVAVLLVQALCATGSRIAPMEAAVQAPRLAVLVPAHDESSHLLPTLASVLPSLRPADRCVVVADNCSDDTAQVARNAGATVVERVDPARRGKGYALAFGIDALAVDPPDVVVVMDADCIAHGDALSRIAALASERCRPVQALYLMTAPSTAGRMAAIAEFAWRVKNWGRPLGYARLGLPCQLAGTGMAFPWIALRAINVASGELVEDVQMGIDLARRRVAPLFCPDARVTSVFATNAVGAKTQRTRWEHGHLAMIATKVPRLVVDALRRGDGASLALALDVAVPPLALLTILVGGAFLAALLATMLGASVATLVVTSCLLLALVVAVALFWRRFGRDIVSPMTLALAFWYALRKLPLYLRFALRRETAWVKSKRDAD